MKYLRVDMIQGKPTATIVTKKTSFDKIKGRQEGFISSMNALGNRHGSFYVLAKDIKKETR